MAPSVIQYGCRDEDDDSDDGKSHRRRGSSKLQFLTRESSKRRMKKLSNVISDTKSLLKGASSSNGVGGHLFLYGLDHNEDEDSSSSYESESESSEDNSDDDGSVCSKASVASKAGKAVKKLGGKLRGSIKLIPSSSGSKRRGSGGSKAAKHGSDDDGSVASSASRSSRASDAMRRVSLKIGKAFKVGSKKHVALEDYSDNSLSSCEDDLFLTPTPRPGPDDRAPSATRKAVARTKSCDNTRPIRTPLSRSLTSGRSSDDKKEHPLRRSLTSDWKPNNETTHNREQSSDDVVESLKKNEYAWNMNVPPSLVMDSATLGTTANVRAA